MPTSALVGTQLERESSYLILSRNLSSNISFHKTLIRRPFGETFHTNAIDVNENEATRTKGSEHIMSTLKMQLDVCVFGALCWAKKIDMKQMLAYSLASRK